MRYIVGVFGILCGLIVVWTVGNYGYASADDASAKWNMAFLFAVIAAGGLFGHAVSVRVWSISKFASICIGVACGAALVINLSNSLGALAGRSSRSDAETASKTTAIKDDRAELKRLQAELAKLGTYVATDQVAVDAAKRALDAATTAKERECGNGDPKQRGRFCRDKEEAEKAAADTLTKAAGAKALTDRALRFEGDMRPIRERLRLAGPIVETNVQGSALAKLFRLPDAEAGFMATVQQFMLATIVEALIVLSMVAFELLGRHEQARLSESKIADREPSNLPVVAASPPMLSPPPRPTLAVASSGQLAGSIAKILTAALEPDSHARIEMAEAYLAYSSGCSREGRRAVTPAEFVDPLKRFCKGAGIRTKHEEGFVYLLDVRLASAEDARKEARREITKQAAMPQLSQAAAREQVSS